MLQGDHLPFGLSVGLGRAPEPFFTIGDVTHDSGLSRDRDVIAYLKVARDSNLAGKDHVIAQLRTTGDSGLGHDQAMLAQGHIVGNLDEIIDLGAAPDDRRTKCPAINGDVGADLDIIANKHAADLGNFAMDPCVLNITKAVRADDSSGMNPHPISNLSRRIQSDIREKIYVFTKEAIWTDEIAALENTSRANAHPFA